MENDKKLGIVAVEDVMNMYDELYPWDKERVACKICDATSNDGPEDVLMKMFGYRPIDLVSPEECEDKYGDDIIDNTSVDCLMENLEGRIWQVDTTDIINLLNDKYCESPASFTEEDIEELEGLLEDIKEEMKKR